LFTGLVQSIGTLASRATRTGVPAGCRMTIRADFAADLSDGESVAIQGICLTVTNHTAREFTVDVSPTTLSLTTAGDWQPGDRLNLERALAMGDRLGGHIVTGHVDGVGRLIRKEPLGNSTKLWFEVPEPFARISIPLGSIAVDGVSLTLNEIEGSVAAVTIIPETSSKTTLGQLPPGHTVNIEADVIAKYVQRILTAHLAAPQSEPASPEGLTWAKLAELGYLART